MEYVPSASMRVLINDAVAYSYDDVMTHQGLVSIRSHMPKRTSQRCKVAFPSPPNHYMCQFGVGGGLSAG